MSGGFTLVGAAAGALAGSIVPGAGWIVGAQIGATLGALADGLTAKDPRVADARFTGATYGWPIPRGWGRCRTDAAIIWALRNTVNGSYIFEHDSFKSKLKGSTTAHYRATFACLILETGFTFPDGSQVERAIVVDRLWMADKIVWQSSSAAPIGGYNSSTTYNYGDYSVGSDGHVYFSIADSNTNHNPTIQPSSWWQLAQTTSGNINLTLHPGPSESTFTQAVDSTMATNVGVDNCPAYRGLTYFVVEDMDLYDIGNQIPGQISVEWHWATPPEDGDFFSDVCRHCGLVSGDIDFSAASSALAGFAQTQQQSGQELLNPVLLAKAYDIAQVDGVVKAIQRGGSSVVTIPDSDLSATLNSEQTPDRMTSTILADTSDLHNQIKVLYKDENCNFRQAAELAVRNNVSVPNALDIDTGLTLAPDDAAKMGGRLLDTEWLEAGGDHSISLPGTYNYIAPTDIVTANFNNKPTRFRVTKTTTVQGRLQAMCARDEIEILTRYETGDDGEAPIPTPATIVASAFEIASPSVDFSDQFAQFPGFYIWANGAPGWRGCQIVYTFDAPGSGTRNWVNGPFVGTASAFGKATSALGDASSAGYESSNSCGVSLLIGSTMALAPQTQAVVNNMNAWALLGNEIVGLVGLFQTGRNTWTIGPGLIRGLRGSNYTGHSSSDTFAVSPKVSGMSKAQVDAQYIGATVYVQALSPGQVVGDSPEKSCVISQPTTPWSTPTHEVPSGAVNGTNVTFGLSKTPRSGSLQLTKNGSTLILGTDYTLSGSTITMAVAPATGAMLVAYYSY